MSFLTAQNMSALDPQKLTVHRSRENAEEEFQKKPGARRRLIMR